MELEEEAQSNWQETEKQQKIGLKLKILSGKASKKSCGEIYRRPHI